jgi:hypothetical protein
MNYQLPATYNWHLETGIRKLASGIWHLAIWHLASGYLASGYLASGIWHLASGYLASGYLASGYLASGYLAIWLSGIWKLASGNWHLASGIWLSGIWLSGIWLSGIWHLADYIKYENSFYTLILNTFLVKKDFNNLLIAMLIKVLTIFLWSPSACTGKLYPLYVTDFSFIFQNCILFLKEQVYFPTL